MVKGTIALPVVDVVVAEAVVIVGDTKGAIDQLLGHQLKIKHSYVGNENGAISINFLLS